MFHQLRCRIYTTVLFSLRRLVHVRYQRERGEGKRLSRHCASDLMGNDQLQRKSALGICEFSSLHSGIVVHFERVYEYNSHKAISDVAVYALGLECPVIHIPYFTFRIPCPMFYVFFVQ